MTAPNSAAPSLRNVPVQPWLALAIVVVLSGLVWLELQPPAVQPASAPASEFSAERAMTQLAVFARRPHPMGSAEHERVCAYLVGQLRSLGLDPQVQSTTGFFLEPWWGPPFQTGRVQNILARIQGTGNTKAVMLISHYDSVAGGPGAGDDGAGVAAILETARALKSGPPLRNDVIFLLTDGEEVALLGAAAFVDNHPWARDVGVVLNFDAQGTSGASLMYETSTHNGRLIREMAKAAPYPVTSSLMAEVAKRFPSSDSDLSVFRRAGMSGLNFGFIGDQPRYHTMRDDICRLDARSLQHHGSYALALARHFGNLDLHSISEDDAVYFNLFRVLVHYPQHWVWPLNAIALAFFASVIVAGIKTSGLTVKRIFLGAGLWIAAAAIAVGLSQLVWMILARTQMIASLPYGDSYNGELYGAGLIALVLAFLLGAYAAARHLTFVDAAASALFCWMLLTIAAGFWAPGGSYLFVWPLLAGTIGLLLALFSRSASLRCAAWAIPAVVALLVFGPAIYFALMLMSDSPLLVTIPAAIFTAVLLPVIVALESRARWIAPCALLVLFALCTIAGVRKRHFDAAHPKADTLFYLANSDNGKAAWASWDDALDVYTSQALTGAVYESPADYGPYHSNCFVRDVPMPALLPPAISVQGNDLSGAGRALKFLITTPRKSRAIWIRLHDIKVQQASVNGKQISPPDAFPHNKDWNLIYWDVPDEGLAVSLELPASPVDMTVYGIFDGVPPLPGGVPLKPRADDLIPSPSFWFDGETFIQKSFRF